MWALSIAVAESTTGARDLPESPRPPILVGPNVRITRSSPMPHVEMQIAASPVDAKTLIATAIATELDRDRCALFASFDGGYTWTETVLADLPATGSGDPQVAFAPDGTAYFTALGTLKIDGRDRFSLLLF